jgi:hypothetical protein
MILANFAQRLNRAKPNTAIPNPSSIPSLFNPDTTISIPSLLNPDTTISILSLLNPAWNLEDIKEDIDKY